MSSSSRLVLPYQTVVDSTGTPIPGALLNFYLSGTSTRSNSYADAGLTTPNPNPIAANAAGLFGNIFLDPTLTYKVVLTDSSGNQIWTADPVVEGQATGYAPLASPAFTGTPTAPTPPNGNDSTRIATTDFVVQAILAGLAASGYASLNSPAFIGTPTAPTAAPGDNTTKIATDAFVTAAIAAAVNGAAHPFLKAANGYDTSPNGFIDQWGTSVSVPAFSTGTPGAVTVTFPKAFPSLCASVVAMRNSSGSGTNSQGDAVNTFTTTGFLLQNYGGNACTFNWLAKGY